MGGFSMLYLHHRVDEDTNYVVDTSDWSMNVINDATVADNNVGTCPDELDCEDSTLAQFWETFADQSGADVNDYFIHTTDLYPLTRYLRTAMNTALRFDAKIDIWATDEYIFCRGYTETGLCICWATDGEDIKFFSFSGLDINQPYVENVEDLSAAVSKTLWDDMGVAAVFYTPAMSRIAFVRFIDANGLCEPELIQCEWGKDEFLYEDSEG